MNVPRIWIMGISSILWIIPAFILLRFALNWSDHIEQPLFIVSVGAIFVGVGLAYSFWFRKIVNKNIRRILSLPIKPKIWSISSPRGYGIVVLMVAMGFVLRSSDLPRVYLAAPYALMGGCLFLGSLQMMRTFIRETQLQYNRQ